MVRKSEPKTFRCQKTGTNAQALDRESGTLFNQIKRVTLLNQTGILVFACYFLAIVAFSLVKRRALPGKTLYLFRALLPSWRFFEDFDEAPTLYCRYGSAPHALSSWEKCLKRPSRHVFGLLYDPEANYVLAASSLILQLLSEVNELAEVDSAAVEKLVSYQLTKNLAQFHSPAQTTRFQFKVSGVTDDLLVSPIYEIGSTRR